MRKIYFKKNGTYVTSKCQLFGDDVEFVGYDISTNRKGHIYTLTKDAKPDKKEKTGIAKCMIDLNYSLYDDMPIDDTCSFSTSINLSDRKSGIELKPFLYQIIACNTYMHKSGYEFTEISIEKITFLSHKGKCVVSFDEFSEDSEIGQLIKNLHLSTHVKEIFGEYRFLLLNTVSRTWELSNYLYSNNNGWTSLLMQIPDTETCYYIPRKMINRLSHVDSITTILRYYDNSEVISESDFCVVTLEDMLPMWLFIPQIIKIQQSIFNVPLTMDLMIEENLAEVNEKIYRFSLSEDQTLYSSNVCLYRLMEALLNMMEKLKL